MSSSSRAPATSATRSPACERVGEARLVWHEETELSGLDAIVVPGGFSYGDYLRAGAIARFSPAMEAVARFAAEGGPVLGICNGFQVLCEAGLLPGALLPNEELRFICRQVELVVEEGGSAFTAEARVGRAALDPDQAHERPLLRPRRGAGPSWSPTGRSRSATRRARTRTAASATSPG